LSRAWARGAAVAATLLALDVRAASPADARFADECARRVPAGRVVVRALPVTPVVDTALSYQELTRMAGENSGHRWVLGLTRPTLRVEASWGFSGLSDPRSGRTCIRPALQMTLRYDPVLVLVGREFVYDACAYDFIFQHEMRHVDVHVRKLREVSLQLQSELQDRLSGVTHVGDRETLERRLRAEVNDYWMPRAERALREVREQHAAIDTPEEYGRARTVCEGRIARYLPRFTPADS
jgi:hypothetical protein